MWVRVGTRTTVRPVVGGALMMAGIMTGCARDVVTGPDGDPRQQALASAPLVTTSGSVVLVGAGNIARCDRKEDEATGKLLNAISGTVFTTGDNIYASGSSSDFTNCYHPAWGGAKSRTRPSPGDTEYKTAGAAGYFGYFGSAAGSAGKGYYSYTAGAWHVVVLNSNLGMAPGSEQESWLRADLAAHPTLCTIAYWHHPRFSSYGTAVRADIKPLWDALYAAGVEIVVNGHYRIYERFAPQTPDEKADAQYGVRQFTVGTGGHGVDGFGTIRPNSEVRQKNVYGVLKLTLGTDTYAWEFVTTQGNGKVTDSGTGTCHGPPGAPVASVTVSPSTATVTSGDSVQLSAVAKDAGGNILTGTTMTWSSRDTLIAKVTAAGLVTGAAAGAVYVIATSEGKRDSARITVEALAPASPVIKIGGRVRAAVTAYIRAEPTVNSTLLGTQPAGARGTVLEGPVVDVSGDGLTRWRIDFDSGVDGWGAEPYIVADTSTTSTAPVVASVTVSPATASVQTSATAQLVATVKDSSGATLTGETVTWASSAPGVATVTATGLVTGVAAGTAVITATSGGKSGSSTVSVTTATTTTLRVGYYVAPNGSSSGDGSYTKPWDLKTALSGANGKVAPGDTIWVRGGTYWGSYTSTVAGTAGRPVVVRAYPGERAQIDGKGSTSSTLLVRGAWSVFWGLEVMNSTGIRTSSSTSSNGPLPHPVVNNASNTKYINLVIHDGGVAFYTYTTAFNVEIYGSIIYNNGWQGPDRGHGHALYLKTDLGPILVKDNVMFNQFGYGLHAYTNGGSGNHRNIRVEGNVAFNNGTLSTNSTSNNYLMGGYEPVSGAVLVNNLAYFSPGLAGTNVRVGYSSTVNQDVVFQGNWVEGGSVLTSLGYWNAMTLSQNTFFGASRVLDLVSQSMSGYLWSGNAHHRDAGTTSWRYGGTSYTWSNWRSKTGLGSADQVTSTVPSGIRIFLRPNLYEPGRATVAVQNWGRQGSVSVDLAGVLPVGAQYEVRNVQDLFGAPVASGTYGGGSITLPLTGVTPPPPIGMSSSRAPRTGPDFDVFLITPR